MALFLKANGQFSLTVTEMANCHGMCSNIKFIDMFTDYYKVKY
jgi:hypothetical protein